MRIYITGIAGMLGANIAYELRNKYDVIGADIVSIKMNHVKNEIFDLMDKVQLEKSIKHSNPDVIIHTAAAVNVDRCEKDHEWAEQLNYQLTQNISEICSTCGIKLISISTDAVFDGMKNGLYDEECAVNPINIYGKTKLKGESEVLKLKNGTVLRTNIYGFNIQDKKSFGEWILYSLLNNDTLSMFTDIFFSPILVNELSNIIDLIIKQDVSGLYHVTGTGSISKYEFANILKKTFNINEGTIIPSLSSDCKLLAKRSKNMGLCNEKIKKELNISISTPEQSIVKFKELYDNGLAKELKKMR